MSDIDRSQIHHQAGLSLHNNNNNNNNINNNQDSDHITDDHQSTMAGLHRRKLLFLAKKAGDT